MIDFKGKVALVTGGSRGIGRSCALALARHGCDVAINYHRNGSAAEETVGKARDTGVTAHAFQADISRQDEIRTLIESVIEKFGHIDILINSAGISQVVKIADITKEDWDAVMDPNLWGLFSCSQLVLEHMKERQSGKIVNIASTAGQVGGFFIGANYSASKAGVICLTKTFAKDAAPHGILVNCVAPGLIDTDMVDGFPQELVDTAIPSIPLGRMGSPDEVANAAVFLASDAASYMTGTTVYVNGGTYMG